DRESQPSRSRRRAATHRFGVGVSGLRKALPFIGVAICLAVFAPGAGAHAILESTSPPRGVTVKSQPKLIMFRFNEAVESSFGAVAFLVGIWLPALDAVAGADARWLEASDRFSRRLRNLLMIALAAGASSEACQLVFQGATGAGGTFWSAVDRTVLREVIHTRF